MLGFGIGFSFIWEVIGLVWFQKISIPTPRKVNGNSKRGGGGGGKGSKAQFFN